MTRGARAIRGKANIGCIVWLAIVWLVGYGLYKVVPVKVATSTFYDAMQEQASFGSIKTVDQIQYAVLQKARELELPVGKENLVIRKDKVAITIEAHYEMTIDFFSGLYKYVWKFDPVVSRPLFAV
jgi:serine protease inhibitor